MKKLFNKGFTLIELLVGIAIIIASATAVVVLLSSAFRISNKTTSLEAVRESGNNAINQIQRTIQFADGFSGVNTVDDDLTYVQDCSVTDPQTVYKYLKVYIVDSSGSRNLRKFSCVDDKNDIVNYGVKLDGADLVDVSSKVDLVPGSCEFTCTQDNITSPPVIGISFSLSLQAASNLPEKNATLDFATSAKMRNL